MIELIQEDPGVSTRGRRPNQDWVRVAEELKANPGVWYKVGENLPIIAGTNIKTARLRAFAPAGAFEASIRGRNETGRAQKVFARYVGN